MSARHIGGSILPSSCAHSLTPLECRAGRLQVRPLPDEDTHALVLTDRDGETVLCKAPERVLVPRPRRAYAQGRPSTRDSASRVRDRVRWPGDTFTIRACSYPVGAPPDPVAALRECRIELTRDAAQTLLAALTSALDQRV